MTQNIILKANEPQHLNAIESECWVANIRWVSKTYWGGLVKDVTSDETVAVADLTDEQLNDRHRFPLFGYTNGKLNSQSGYTQRWDIPHESPVDGKFYMPKPTDERIVELFDSVSANYPEVTEIEAEWIDLFPYVEGV